MLSVQNAGTAPLTIDSIAFLLSTRFTTTTTTPILLDPGASQNVTITYLPQAFTADTATFLLRSNDPDEANRYVGLKGNGVYAGGTLSAPSGYNFGARRTGSSNVWRLVLQNQGGGSIHITGLSLSHPDYSLDSVTLPIVIDSLQRVTLGVWYRPGAVGTALDTLRITSDAANGPVTSSGSPARVT